MRKEKDSIESRDLNIWVISTDSGSDVKIVLQDGDPDRESYYSIRGHSFVVQSPLGSLKIWQNRDSFNEASNEENQTITGIWLEDGSKLNVSFYINNSEFDELLNDPILGALCTRDELSSEECGL